MKNKSKTIEVYNCPYDDKCEPGSFSGCVGCLYNPLTPLPKND